MILRLTTIVALFFLALLVSASSAASFWQGKTAWWGRPLTSSESRRRDRNGSAFLWRQRGGHADGGIVKDDDNNNDDNNDDNADDDLPSSSLSSNPTTPITDTIYTHSTYEDSTPEVSPLAPISIRDEAESTEQVTVETVLDTPHQNGLETTTTTRTTSVSVDSTSESSVVSRDPSQSNNESINGTSKATQSISQEAQELSTTALNDSSIESAIVNRNNPTNAYSAEQTDISLSSSATTAEPQNSNATLLQEPLPAWKAAFPPSLQRKGPKTLQRLIVGDVEIILLGTAHVSNDSCHDVRLLLESVHPSCIFVELCEARIPLLEGSTPQEEDDVALTTAEPNSTIDTTKKLSWGQRVAQIQQSQGGSKWQAICTLLLTSVQEDYADTLGVELGGEFRVAHEYWKEQRHPLNRRHGLFPVLILGDRPLSLTLVRAWESLRWWPKLKVMVGLFWSSFSKPKPDEIREWLESVLREESDVLTESLADLRQHFPTLHTTIIAERDAWLACKLVQTCRILHGSTGASAMPKSGAERHRATVVAIVGAGHVPGIVEMLTNSTNDRTPESILHDLCQTTRWEKDEEVQTQVIPQWVNDVTQIQDLAATSSTSEQQAAAAAATTAAL